MIAQSLPLPIPSIPDGNVTSWMLWVMALAVIVMGWAVYRMFLKFTDDKSLLVADVQKAKLDALVQLETSRVRIEELHKEIAVLNRALGMAEARLERVYPHKNDSNQGLNNDRSH